MEQFRTRERQNPLFVGKTYPGGTRGAIVPMAIFAVTKREGSGQSTAPLLSPQLRQYMVPTARAPYSRTWCHRRPMSPQALGDGVTTRGSLPISGRLEAWFV